MDHECALSKVVVEQANRIAQLEHAMEKLKASLLGSRSERGKLPRIKLKPVSAEEQLKTRKERAAKKAETPVVTTTHRVPDEQRKCPSCGNDALTPLGKGQVTTVYEFVPARFIRHEHIQEVLRCKCNGHVVTAPGAPKIIEGGQYGASFLAHLVVAKCADHLPIYRIEKEFARQGVPMARSTMNELFYRAATITEPLWRLLLSKICQRPVVMADETRLRMLDGPDGKSKNGFVWTFCAQADDGKLDIGYTFAPHRAGSTPRLLLEGTGGVLLADSYSGYNEVERVSTRVRAACHAHLRRYFFEAIKTAPVAQEAIDIVAELYRVEHSNLEVGAEARLVHRRQHAQPIRDKLNDWLERQASLHPPKSPIGIAIAYARNHWAEFGVFLDDAGVPLDNNASERALRRVALGRKNYLFVKDENTGMALSGLYALVATCEARRINPFEYLTDVLQRIQDHRADSLDELLPAQWDAAA
jgi:transposase